MSTPSVSPNPLDDAAKAAAYERALDDHERYQRFLKGERDQFCDLARKDLNGHRPKLLKIYDGALVDAVHFGPAFEIAAMTKFMHKLGLGDRPAAYAFGGYQKGAFKLPDKETDATTKEKILLHTFRCVPSSIILRDLVDKKTTTIPWHEAAVHSAFNSSRKPDGSWDKTKLIELATEIQEREERILKGLLLKTGPWLLWFHPDPGAWADNWKLGGQFVIGFNSLPDSIRLGFSPYLFTAVTLDPTKAAPPAPPTAPPAAAHDPAPATSPPVQYPSDDQPL